MKLKLSREALLRPLQAVIGVVERRQTMPILSNILLSADAETVQLTATDLEVELVARVDAGTGEPGEITLPGRKLLDIVRALPEEAEVSLSVEDNKAQVRAGRSRFALATMPAAEFPNVEGGESLVEFSIAQRDLRHLIEQTQFAMAQQDVRYYLNGLLLEFRDGVLRGVATDGHRLSRCDVSAQLSPGEVRQVIVPRKGVLELYRLLEESDETVSVSISSNHIRVGVDELKFTSKLVDGRFPDYERVIPRGGNNILQVDRQMLRQALGRTAILSNEKYRGVRLEMDNNRLGLQAQNPEQERAEEDVEVEYQGERLEIGFNVSYLLDPLAALESDSIELILIDGNSSCVIRAPGDESTEHVVMPMRL